MPITKYFNETELAIFYRQTQFTFDEYYRSPYGFICAIDHNSGQIFVGDDLLRNYVHKLDSIASVEKEDGNVIKLTFSDNTSVKIPVEEESAEALYSEIFSCIIPVEFVAHKSQGEFFESDDKLTETVSRLDNSGTISAVDYLVTDTKMGVKEAYEYVGNLDKQKESKAFPVPNYDIDGNMSKVAILSALKRVRPGDKVHIESKSLLGKLHVYDADFQNVEVRMSSRNILLRELTPTYQTLMDTIAEELFNFMNIILRNPYTGEEITCRLKRVIKLVVIK